MARILMQAGQVGAGIKPRVLLPADRLLKPDQDGRGGKSVGGLFGNVLKSGVETAKGVGSAIFHPFRTVSTVAKLGAGGIERGVGRLTGKEISSEDTRIFDAFAGQMRERYGSPQKLLETMYSDPVGFALDASVFLEGAGVAGKVAGAGRAAELISKAGEIADPLRTAAKVAKGLGIGAGKGGEFLLGLTTRRGPGTIREAFEAGEEGGEAQKAFKAGMRGDTTEAAVVGRSRGALGKIIEERGAAYRRGLDEIEANYRKTSIKPRTGTMVMQVQETGELFNLSLQGLKSKITTTLKNFGVKVRGDNLDFSSSPLMKSDERTLREMTGVVKNWKEITPKGVNNLAIKLGNYADRTTSNALSSIASSLKRNIRDYLGERVPEVGVINRQYAESSVLIEEVQKDLSLGDKASVDRAFKTLTNAVKKDSELKTGLMRELESYGAKNLIKEIAGVNLSEVLPDDIFRIAIDISTLFSAGFGLGEPTAVLEVLSTSPRIVGEFVNALGVGTRAGKNATEILNKYKLLKTAGYVGRIGAVAGRGRPEELQNSRSTPAIFRKRVGQP